MLELFQPPTLDFRMTIRIVLVEDDVVVRQHLTDVLSTQTDFDVMASFDSVAPALAGLRELSPDVLIADLGLPDGSGIDVIRTCASLHPASERLVISVFGDDDNLFASLQAGATGYLLKDDMPSDIIACVRTLVAGGSPISPSIARRVLRRLTPALSATLAGDSRRGIPAMPPDAPTALSTPPRNAPAADATPQAVAVDATPALTPREIEILTLIAKGPNQAEIATLLQVSPYTVGTHVKNIYRKLAVHTRTEAVFEGRQLGLLQP